MNSEMRIDGYRVEARTSYHMPCAVNGQIIDGQWRTVEFGFGNNSFGVPTSRFGDRLHKNGLMSLNQAQAMRYWFLAQADAEGAAGSLCLETRLARHQLTEKVTVERLGEIDAQNSRGKPLTTADEATP